ncbi:MAG: hypothetical protein P3B98_02275 [Gemmatimonadota bacterium]|nr:hypothetical protein [Gemmatimonadota bacterium]
MSERFTFVLDDRELASSPASTLIGPRAFGGIVFRRSTLAGRVSDALKAAGGVDFVHARSDAEYLAALAATAREGSWCVIWHASAVARSREAFLALLARLRLAEQQVRVGARRTLAVVGPGLVLQQTALDPWGLTRDWPVLDVDDGLVDLTDYREALRFLSGGFEARHFNNVSADDATVTKRSQDIAKISAEHDFYYLLPDTLRSWFVAPTNLTVGEGWASYQMPRHYVPDAALQWIHGALSPEDFERLLDATFAFLDARPVRGVSVREVGAAVDALYLTKVEQRIAALEATPQSARLNGLLQFGTRERSLRDLVARYHAHFTRHRAALCEPAALAIGHGDLCFSNMLYDADNGQLRLIDPRGARTEAELWTHAGYDLAKLSHSVLGDYDWITSGRYRVAMDDDRSLGIHLIDGNTALAPRKQAFVTRIEQRGIDPRVLRTCEASLFLSMLPLHSEHPNKLLALTLNVARILDELDANA